MAWHRGIYRVTSCSTPRVNAVLHSACPPAFDPRPSVEVPMVLTADVIDASLGEALGCVFYHTPPFPEPSSRPVRGLLRGRKRELPPLS
jgi:hypothetical protein